VPPGRQFETHPHSFAGWSGLRVALPGHFAGPVVLEAIRPLAPAARAAASAACACPTGRSTRRSSRRSRCAASRQYVAWRSGDAALLSQIDDELGDDSALVQLRQWPYAEFLPIALQFDMLFERVGWLKGT